MSMQSSWVMVHNGGSMTGQVGRVQVPGAPGGARGRPVCADAPAPAPSEPARARRAGRLAGRWASLDGPRETAQQLGQLGRRVACSRGAGSGRLLPPASFGSTISELRSERVRHDEDPEQVDFQEAEANEIGRVTAEQASQYLPEKSYEHNCYCKHDICRPNASHEGS